MANILWKDLMHGSCLPLSDALKGILYMRGIHHWQRMHFHLSFCRAMESLKTVPPEGDNLESSGKLSYCNFYIDWGWWHGKGSKLNFQANFQVSFLVSRKLNHFCLFPYCSVQSHYLFQYQVIDRVHARGFILNYIVWIKRIIARHVDIPEEGIQGESSPKEGWRWGSFVG
jgi:hypothetical protein